MRLGFDGLAAKVQGVLAVDPFCGHALVFRNRRGDRLKLLLWDGLGFWLVYRRLDQGRLHWPHAGTVVRACADCNPLPRLPDARTGA
ncbi:IS66 family insertion sequence element accessory protein TnpB [Acidithiobacillus thiooxidans]|uniref:IS66 family insertion sequence element accessory protein TnpB n=1 Tax=Acidithiobacillus thiooxidans TaxID=930 RepID=UPI0035B596AD